MLNRTIFRNKATRICHGKEIRTTKNISKNNKANRNLQKYPTNTRSR